MASKPYLRTANDGTYELLVPLPGGVHILPYCFHTEEDAKVWLTSRKGRAHIRQLRARYQRGSRRDQVFLQPAPAVIPTLKVCPPPSLRKHFAL